MRRELVVVAVLAAAAGGGAAAYGGRETARAEARREAEVRRIRAHFDSVEHELLARDVSHLTSAQRRARVQQIRTLHLYRQRGVFPENRDFPGLMVPYFVDAGGRLCAVAHLLAAGGRRDIVDRVATRRNNAWVAELGDEPGLVAWLDSAGLSVEEAARIQVPYMGPPPEQNAADAGPAARRENDGARLLASGLIASSTTASLVWNLRRYPGESPRRGWRDALALAAGAVALSAGATQLDESGAPRALGLANAAVGVASTSVALHRLLSIGGAAQNASRPVSTAAATARPSTPSVSLALSPALPAGTQTAPGVVMSVRF